MKIGFLAERLIKGFGVDLVIHNQANGLADLGHEVTVYVQRYEKGFFENQKYKVVEIDSPLLFNPLKTEYKLLRRKLKFFRKEQNDVWLIHTWPFYVLIPFLKGKKYVVDHGTVSTEGMYLKMKLVFWYQKYMSRLFYFAFATKILPISKYLQHTLPFHIRWKSKVLYNGANHYTSTYIKDPKSLEITKDKLGIKDDEIYMLYVGRLNHGAQPYKGVANLVEIYTEAKQRVPNLKLIMGGFGSDEDVTYLKSKDILAINNVPTELLLQLFDICDFYVSASKWEGFNLPMVEAQDYGKISVVYEIGPHKEILNSGVDSFVVKTHDEFVEKVVFLAQNETFRKEHAKDAKENAKKYTWEKCVKNLNEIISKK